MIQPAPRRSFRLYLSWALFALSAALFIVVAVIWYRDRDEEPRAAPIPAVPGKNEAINVKQALEQEGIAVTFAPGGGRSDLLLVAGQYFKVDDADLYVFIYPEGVAQREADAPNLDPNELAIVNTRGTPVPGGPPKVYAGSNVIVALFGGSDDLAQKVQRAIENLP